MKTKIYQDKLDNLLKIDASRELIKQTQAELDLLQSRDKVIDRMIADDMRESFVIEKMVDEVKFILDREVTTTILRADRQDAIKYNNKFKIGIFALTVQGMKLKAWVKDILNQNMSVPEFVSYEEYPKIKVEKSV